MHDGPGALPQDVLRHRTGVPDSLAAKALRAWSDFAEEPLPRSPAPAGDEIESEVDAVLEEFGGDVRAALRALLHDVAVLAADFTGAVSRGFVRGQDAAGMRRARVRRR